MEHPPKQGLKQERVTKVRRAVWGFNGTSTKTRIETSNSGKESSSGVRVLMEHPPKQGLKPNNETVENSVLSSFNGTSTKTRIETSH